MEELQEQFAHLDDKVAKARAKDAWEQCLTAAQRDVVFAALHEYINSVDWETRRNWFEALSTEVNADGDSEQSQFLEEVHWVLASLTPQGREDWWNRLLAEEQAYIQQFACANFGQAAIDAWFADNLPNVAAPAC